MITTGALQIFAPDVQALKGRHNIAQGAALCMEIIYPVYKP